MINKFLVYLIIQGKDFIKHQTGETKQYKRFFIIIHSLRARYQCLESLKNIENEIEFSKYSQF